MAYNSTIRQKTGNCEICGKPGPLTKKRCHSCYWGNIKMKSVIRQQEREVKEDKSLSSLIEDLDTVFSQYIRLKEADSNKGVACYTCGKKDHWKYMDASHFIPRSHMYTRFSETNVKPCCPECNRLKDGNLAAFGKHLEEDHPGSVELLQEQSRIIYKYTYQELKDMIISYSQKIKQLK